MIRTVRGVIDHLLLYLTPEERSLPPTDGSSSDNRSESALTALNGAMQELYGLSDDRLFSTGFSEKIFEPLNVSVDVTKGSRNLILLSLDDNSDAFLPWMDGCTIIIDGDGNDNEINKDIDTVSLRHPAHDTGIFNATIYHDSITLPAEFREIVSPIIIPGVGEMFPATGEKDLRAKAFGYNHFEDEDYGFNVHGGIDSAVFSSSKPIGLPRFYWVDVRHQNDERATQRVKLLPMPNESNIIKFRASVTPPKYDISDIYVLDHDAGISSNYTLNAFGFDYNLIVTDVNSHPPFQEMRKKLRFTAFPDQVFDITSIIVEPFITTYNFTSDSLLIFPPENPNLSDEFRNHLIFEGVDIDPETNIPAPNDFIESVIIPYAAQRFKSSPFFRNDSATAEISRQFATAERIIKEHRAQPKTGVNILPPY